MSEPLVDAEGFPRNDIDLYQVRTARHNIICEWGAGAGGVLPGAQRSLRKGQAGKNRSCGDPQASAAVETPVSDGAAVKEALRCWSVSREGQLSW